MQNLRPIICFHYFHNFACPPKLSGGGWFRDKGFIFSLKLNAES